jgi:GAF domain-containing protein
MRDADPKETVARLCRLAVRLLPVDGASVSLMTQGAARQILHSTGAKAAELSEAQYSLGNGPCLRAFTTQAPALAPDLNRAVDAQYWPVFALRALELGVAAVFSFPLAVGAITVGTMDLHRAEPGPLAEAEIGVALMLADSATLAVMRVFAGRGEAEFRQGEGEMSWLGGESDYDEVHQATGMVMVQRGIGAEEALLRLRARAFTVGVALRTLAREVVAREVRLDEDE